jgi:hypothetical protein
MGNEIGREMAKVFLQSGVFLAATLSVIFGAIWFVGGQMAKQDAENRKVVDNPCRDLQVGPAYRMTEGDDPFSTQPIVRIIEIKRGYVLYTFLDANLKAYGGEPKSRKCSVFTELYVPL